MTTLKKLNHFPKISFDYGTSALNEPEATYPLITLDSVAYVFNLALPLNNISPLTIIIDVNWGKPVCFRSLKKIYLSSPSTQWDKIAYQFAHELCHYVIPDNVPTNLRWLEESICELSSYYFLPRLSKYWRRSKIPLRTVKGNKPYYREFELYAKNDQKKATPFDLYSLTDDASPELNQLIKNCELREKNAFIAKSLLPIFQKTPDTWHAVPLLGTLNPDLPLRDSLEEWIARSPEEARTGLQEMAQLFGSSILLS